MISVNEVNEVSKNRGTGESRRLWEGACLGGTIGAPGENKKVSYSKGKGCVSPMLGTRCKRRESLKPGR